jgi:2-polyprenyl-3-methyl-5-hydroxy-6-metoxy-1,4-benzoquinol methylase
LALSFIFKLNKFVVYLAANISNPFFIPFLSYGSIQIGYFVTTGNFLNLSIDSINSINYQFYENWILGSIILGTSLGLFFSLLLSFVLKDKSHFSKSVNKLGKAFSKQGFFLGKSSIGKCKYDPIYKDLILNHIPGNVDILDIGGGQGFLPILYSLYHGHSRNHTIIDWDIRKITQGNLATKDLKLNLNYKNGNVFNYDIWKKYDCIVLIDILHYNNQDEQDKLLKKAIHLLNPGGILILRDMDKNQKLKNWVTSAQEKICLFVGRTKGKKIYSRNSEDFVKIFSENNTIIKYKKAQGPLFSNLLFVCEKKN